MTSMAPARPSMMANPQIMSRKPQARMPVRRSQSAVKRVISQPGRRSKYENDNFCRFVNASKRMSWLTKQLNLPAIHSKPPMVSATTRLHSR